MSDDIEELLRKSVEALAAMSPAERMAMFARQRESWVRSMAPCEHGVSDWKSAGFLGMTAEMVERNYGHHHPSYQKEAAKAL